MKNIYILVVEEWALRVGVRGCGSSWGDFCITPLATSNSPFRKVRGFPLNFQNLGVGLRHNGRRYRDSDPLTPNSVTEQASFQVKYAYRNIFFFSNIWIFALPPFFSQIASIISITFSTFLTYNLLCYYTKDDKKGEFLLQFRL